MTEFDPPPAGANPSQQEVIAATLILLRKIRGFPGSLHIGDPDYTSSQRRQSLLDAESVGSACARFLIVPANGSVNEGRDDWLRIMTELSPKYHSFPVTSRSSLRMAIERLDSVVDLLDAREALTITDPASLRGFERCCLESNETRLSLQQDLLDQGLVIFSPLSADYLQACLLQRFITAYLTPTCFRLKPVILDEYLEPVAMPDCDADQDWTVGVTRKDVLVVNNTSYDTLKATWRAVRRLPIPIPGMG